MTHTRYTARIENWAVFMHRYLDEYIIWGNIYDDDKGRWVDGEYFHTSGIFKYIIPEEGKVVTTRNSTYLLGKEKKID